MKLNGKRVRPTLLEELYGSKIGPPTMPVLWIADAIYLPAESFIVGPHQTWFKAREEARKELTRRYQWYISDQAVEVFQL